MSRPFLLLGLLAVAPLATAQHTHHGHTPMPAPAPASPDPHAGHAPPADPHAGHAPPADPHAGHTLLADPHAGHASASPVTALPEPNAAERAAAFPVLHSDHATMHAPAINHYLLVDRLEARGDAAGHGLGWELEGWWGSDSRRLWLRAEGQRPAGRASDGHLDLLYGQATGPWWEAVAGIRHEHGVQRRSRAAIGLQGQGPYKVDTRLTLLLGGAPGAELEATAGYSLLLTSRLLLEPWLEAQLLQEPDPQRGLGRGLAGVEAGLRLRYRITPRVGPYIGLTHQRVTGPSAGLARRAGQDTTTTYWVAGLNFWF